MARILLVPGFWLGAWAWDDVAADLRARGDDALALTLPGLDPADDDRLDATLEMQAQAILDEIASDETVVVVAHSAGAAPTYLATDIAPLPDWDQLEADGNSLAGLDEVSLARFRERAVSEPTGIAAAPLRLSDSPARLAIPTTVICNSITADMVEQLRDAGQEPLFAELAEIDAEYIDLPTGHWPMWSRYKELAELIHTIANR
ncbi:alpha/beta hydrolase [Nocardia sp. NPDC049707]|uniref:alpha/beta fold hydrolase n=1 Tax=Nocardia sp. NPDC049707 TaxID=3154735 RepID=UPI0034357569